MSKYVKKLGSDKTYKRPKTTYQEKLTADEIAEKLQGYEKVDDIAEVPLNTHLRYFTTRPDGTQIFRTGGFLHNKQNPEKYIMLTNGKDIWSVQVKGTIFFRKMSAKEEIDAVHALYKKKLAEKDEIIDKLKRYIKAKIGAFDQNIITKNILSKPKTIINDQTINRTNNFRTNISQQHQKPMNKIENAQQTKKNLPTKSSKKLSNKEKLNSNKSKYKNTSGSKTSKKK